MADIVKLLPPLTPTELAQNHRRDIIAGNVTVAGLATVAVILRLWTRYFHTKGFQADDYLIIAALPFSWGMAAGTIVATNYGLGKHLLAVLADDPTNLVREGQAYFATELLWATAIPLIKLSILLLYVRIFGRLRYMRITAWFLSVFTVAWSIMVIVVCMLQCRPMALIWDKSIEGTCINSWVFFVTGSAINTTTDVVLLILPLPAIWGLQLSNFQRISLTGVFLLGSLTCIISIVRLVNVIQDNNNMDVTFALGIVSIWSTAEPCLGIVAACLPTLRPLFHRFMKTLPTTRPRGTAASGYGASINKHYGSSSNTTSQNNDFNIELKGPSQKGFRELHDDDRVPMVPNTRVAVLSDARYPDGVKEGTIEVHTTWESRRS